jgi:hypothetical protein
MRAFKLIVACTVVAAACAAPGSSQPFVGTLPRDAKLKMSGVFTLSADGAVRLALAKRCTATATASNGVPFEAPCDRKVLDGIHVIAHTPWDQDIPGAWVDSGHIVFQVDWKAAGLDPLAADAPGLAARAWTVSGTQWTPSPDDVAMILKQIGDATETETQLVHGGRPPSLEVTAFEIEGDALHAGDASTLIVRITNRGPGAAYRVVATTRSSIEALHGQRISFGLIKPGADKVRKLLLTVPPSETARDTMLVVAVSEGNGFAPSNVSRRMPIAPSTAAPVLALRCTVGGKEGARPDLDAGQRFSLRCTVDNTGDAVAKQVELEVSVASRSPVRSPPQAIAVAGHLGFDVPIIVPRDLPIDAPVEIAIVARDRQSSRTARTTVVGVVRKPKLCTPGQLTHAQYQAKVTELRAALGAKYLTQDEFDRYDAELVACLK